MENNMSNNNPINLRLNDYNIFLDIADSDGNRKFLKGNYLNSIFNNKNGVEFVDDEQMPYNVMQKTAEQPVTLMSTQVESRKTNAKKQCASSQLAKLLYEDMKGIGTSENISKHINAINKKNVINVMQDYKENNDNKDHNSLISDIMEEYGLDINERIKYVNHIFNSLINVCKAYNIYVDDIVEKFNRELIYQKRTWTPANSERLDCLINQLMARKEGTRGGQQRENIRYNGKIDKNFKQGRTGDCWLLASIKAIAKQPKGLEILNNMIKVKSNGNVTVTLKGVNKTYEFTKQEIAAHTEYATGDLDVRIIEMAVNKYCEEDRGVRGRPDINGNYEHVAYYILTGKGRRNFLSDTYGRILDRWFTDEQIDNFNKRNHVAVVSARGKKSDIHLKSTSGRNAILCTGHAYAVSRSDSKYVYLINPWDTSTEIPVDRKTFKSFFNSIDEFDL